MQKRFLLMLTVVLCLALVFAGCGGSGETPAATSPSLNDMTLEQLIEQAKAEGALESVGMPDSWANWGETWEEYTAAYSIPHVDTDMSSAEEIAMFKAEKDSPTKDIGDVGPNFAIQAAAEGILQPYKTTYWDSVPDWAKDDQGLWMIAYTGVLTFMSNLDLVGEAPASWQDVRQGDYKVTAGDVISGATAQATVLSTAYAFGGDMDNLDPAFEFWAEMAQAGRLDPGEITLARIQAGEIAMVTSWCYNTFGWKDSTPTYNFDIAVPSDGTIRVGYASIINAYAPHPAAAALAREYIFSDEGQINLAKGYALPTRDVELPAEIADKVLAPETYAHAVIIEDYDAYSAVCAEISTRWQEEIVPLL